MSSGEEEDDIADVEPDGEFENPDDSEEESGDDSESEDETEVTPDYMKEFRTADNSVCVTRIVERDRDDYQSRPELQRAEYANILARRIEELNRGALPLIKADNMSATQIAEKEIKARVLPHTCIRVMKEETTGNVITRYVETFNIQDMTLN